MPVAGRSRLRQGSYPSPPTPLPQGAREKKWSRLERRNAIVKVIEQLIAYFEERGKLTPKQLRQLVEKGYWGQYTAADLRSLEDKIGQSFFFQVTGEENGPLWGTDV